MDSKQLSTGLCRNGAELSHNNYKNVCVCVQAQSCTNSTRSGRVANSNLQFDKRCHDKQKAEPCKSGGVCCLGNSQKQRRSQRGREGSNERKGGNEMERKTDKDKLKGRSDVENTKIQGACHYSHESYACCLVFEDFTYHLFTHILCHLK